MQHRAPRHTAGRHRRTIALPSHRAPREPIGEKSRYAMAAALVAGVGVAGVSVVEGNGTPAGAATRAQLTPLAGASPSAAAFAASVSGTSITPPAAWGTGVSESAATSGAAFGAGGETGLSSVSAVVAPSSGVADGVPVGGIDLGDDFVAQRLKERPAPVLRWVNPMPQGSVTSCFGERWGRLHAGVDLAAPHGTAIVAAGTGVVVAAGPADGYGNAVLVDHGNGYLTHYAHMSAITVQVGQHVAVGEQVGNEGSTGHSTGPHLHFEVHRGTYKNPIEPTAWMHNHGVDIPGCTVTP